MITVLDPAAGPTLDCAAAGRSLFRSCGAAINGG
jgi:hypothetical protein